MKKLMDWLANSFAPAANKLFSKPWLSGIASAMQKILPFILTGSIVFFYNVFRSYLDFLPDLGIISTYTFFLIGMITAFMVGCQLMEKLGLPHYRINVGLVSIALMFMFCVQAAPEGTDVMSRLGPDSILVGMVAGITVSIVFNLYSKLHVLENNLTLPDFVSEWINNILPILATLLIGMVLTVNLNIDVYQAMIDLFMPLQVFGQSLPGLIILVFIPTFFYSMGISSWMFSALQNPIFLAGITANIAAVAAGEPATNIVTNETVYTMALIMLGGTGATLMLNVFMVFSKSKKLKTMGRVCIGPSIFNINEPIVFGAPIVFNPVLMLPMWINGIVGPVVIWFAMSSGLLNIPSFLMQVGQIPAPFSSVMITNDMRAVLVWAFLIVLYGIIWYPFFKTYEKQCLQEEAEEAANLEAAAAEAIE